MSEIEIQPPFRIPTQEDYAVGAGHLDSLFDEKEGAWYLYNRESMIDAKLDVRLHDKFSGMSSLARLVEPIENDQFKPVDPMFRATHAFRAGMWTAGMLGFIVFEDKMKYKDIHNALAASMPNKVQTGQEDYEKNGGYLKSLGDQGLEAVGPEARQYIDKWGEELVYEPSVRQYYALGTGALLAVYHQVYENSYEDLVSRYEDYQVSKLLDFDQLDEYLSSDSDSSSN